MAIVVTASNHFKYKLANGDVDLDTDTLKVILMNNTFAFDKDAHATLADVTSSQLATANGYTQDNETLANTAIAEDDANDRCRFTCDDVTWTAASGNIGPSGAAIVYDDTTADDTVCWCMDYGVDYTVPDTASLQLQNIILDIT